MANKSYVVLVSVDDFGGSTSLEIKDVDFEASRKLAGGGGGGGGGGGSQVGQAAKALSTLASPILGSLLRSGNSSKASQATAPNGSETVVSKTLPVSEGVPNQPETPNPDNPPVTDKPKEETPSTPDPKAVPTPALLPGLIGMGAKLWTKRKAEVPEPDNN
ncbi:MAG: PTPA-CTERM sorting domain-containing protein [Cyanobacteria bacterium Co-bin8]|nr:PTPA-CTERM sorting domain-containing protein [Cyanobacteria bacterium Co-bin8]